MVYADPLYLSKSASTLPLESRRKCEEIMDKIYREKPAHWPHGLSVAGHDGGIWLIRKSKDDSPVGFVGWQERRKGLEKVGYYTIGILPEYRNQGMAKKAVYEIIQKKASGVDRVQAYIVDGNTASEALADSVGVEVVKEASIGGAGKLLAHTLIPAGGAAVASEFMDKLDPSGGEQSPFKSLMDVAGPDKSMDDYWSNFSARDANYALNALGGAGAGAALLRGKLGIAAASALMAPASNFLVAGIPALRSYTKSLEDKSKLRDYIMPGLAAAGIGGAGLLGWKLLNSINRPDTGRVSVTLPTKDPGDAETVLSLPVEALGLSKTMRGKLHRDAKRRLREESKERTRKRKPRVVPPPVDEEAPPEEEQEENFLSRLF